jgi:predicted RNA-binding Zn-ribbon protein involved in translation (DUF1610 family)
MSYGYEEDNEYGWTICEVCGNEVYVGDNLCFICPDCGTAQNI